MSPGVEDYEDFEASLGPGQLEEDKQTSTARAPEAEDRSGAEEASLKSDLLNQSGVKAAQWQNKTLGNYRLARVLGDGGMGIVFQAEDINLHRTVALKVLRRRIKDSRENKDVELFLREARGAASLDHPNIVRIFQIDQHKGWWYIAMEYLEGGSLMNLVKSKGPLEPSRAAMLIADAANGLTEAHANGIVHRDIKPANLMLTRKGTCKVADFGLVKMDDPNDPFRLNTTPVGTPVYIAPEIVMQKAATPASDVYSLSATLYTVLTARPPFKGKTRKDFLEHALKTQPPELRELAPHCSQILGDLIKAGMSKDPKMRPNAKAFAATLRSEISASLALEAASQHSSMIMSMPSSAALRSQTSGFVLQSHASGIINPDARKDRFRLPLVLATAAIGTLLVVGIVALGFMLAKNPFMMASQQQIQQDIQARQEREERKQASIKKEREDMIGVKSEATIRWGKARVVNPGPGTDEALEKAQAHETIAIEYEKAANYLKAADEYKLLSEISSKILLTDQKRSKTLLIKKQVEGKRLEALKLGATNIDAERVKDVWLPVTQALDVANQKYQEAVFEEANVNYQQVLTKIDAALVVLKEWRVLEEAEQAYERELAKLDASLMHEYGGDRWTKLLFLKEDALDLKVEEKVLESASIYKKAMALLPGALNQAMSNREEAKAELKKHIASKADKLINDAKRLNRWETGKLAIPFLKEALRLIPEHKQAQKLIKQIQGYYQPGHIVATDAGFNLAYIPSGEFVMGSPASEAGRDLNERQHPVRITRPFFMGITEVTQGQWAHVMGKDYEGEDDMRPTDVSKGRYIGPDYPVFGVNWREAKKFCDKLNEMEPGKFYRLPTEAEWEYACRAGSKTPFWNGSTIQKKDANLDTTQPYGGAPEESPLDRLTPVGQYAKNNWGLLDMHGNLGEWCQDWQGNYKIGAARINPTGPSDDQVNPATSYKVVRGGSFIDVPKDARAAKRVFFAPITRKGYLGFRVVMELREQVFAKEVLGIDLKKEK